MDYPIHTLLSRTAHTERNYLRPYLSELGLSPGQPKLLRYLAAQGAASQRELADYCEVDPSAVCRMLDVLERGGFLERRPAQNDRRAGRVVLSDRGREAFRRWEERCMEIEDRMLQGFTPEERAQLADYLARAYRNVGGRMI